MQPRDVLLVILVFFSLVEIADAAETRGDWQLGLDLRAESSDAAAGGAGQLGVRYRLFDDWSLELLGRSGALGALSDEVDSQILLGMALGGAWSPRTLIDAWAPRISVRATHIHHASTESWGDSPGANLAGTSSGGVVHRTGAELGVAALTPGFWRLGDWQVGGEIELTGGALPGSKEMGWTAGLMFGLSFETVDRI